MTVPSLATTLHRVFSLFGRAKLQISAAPDKTGDVSITQAFASDSAHAEGWNVFDCGIREDGSIRREIQRLDCSPTGAPTFGDDGAAWEHVVAQARAGSKLHQAALPVTPKHALIRVRLLPLEILTPIE